MARKVRLQDIADKMGVSVGTVSRALAGRPGPGDALRAEIIRLASTLGWRKDGRFSVQVLHSITLMAWQQYLLDVGNDFFNGVLDGVRKEAATQGVLLKSCLLDRTSARVEDAARQLADADGILSLGIDGPEWRAMLLKTRRPVVLAVGKDPDMALDCVAPAWRNGARKATRYLLQLGHRNILHMAAFDRTAAIHRADGFRDALTDFGIPFDREKHVIALSGVSADHVRTEILERWGDRLKAVSAVFCAPDTVAMGLISACHEIGLHVPQDLSVVGFDDIPLAALFHPGLTTVKVGRGEIGRVAVRRLIERAIHPDATVWELKLGGRLVIRGSAVAPGAA